MSKYFIISFCLLDIYLCRNNGVVNEEQRIKVANRDPDNLLVSWVAGCYTEFDIPKEGICVYEDYTKKQKIQYQQQLRNLLS
jgi:hypothetical protein